MPGYGTEQRKKLDEVIREIKAGPPRVTIDDIDTLYAYGLTIRDWVIALRALAAPILHRDIITRLSGIDVDVDLTDFTSTSEAMTELGALVPTIEDALAEIDGGSRRPPMDWSSLQSLRIQCDKLEWSVGEELGSGGLGRVFLVESNGLVPHAAKFIPKDPGADRELLFPRLADLKNVVPVVNRCQWDNFWIIVMPKAKKSLADLLSGTDGPLSTSDARSILVDIANALVSMKDRVVHRDIKPSNILLIDDSWCLADFGISKYAEATTAPDTRKHFLTPAYAAPEQWRGARATTATDVYSFGVVAYQLFVGTLPFTGPERHDYRQQHLKGSPKQIARLPAGLRSLVDSCLRKPPEARPAPATILSRLTESTRPQSPAAQRLQEASSRVARMRSEMARKESVIQSEQERKEEIQQAAQASYDKIVALLKQRIQDAAPECTANWIPSTFAMRITLGNAVLIVGPMTRTDTQVTLLDGLRWEILAFAEIVLHKPRDHNRNEGRSHSLWYMRQSDADGFRWYELAFECDLRFGRRAYVTPFSLPPESEDVRLALSRGAVHPITEALSPAPIDQGNEFDFVERWIGHFADAS